jgi:alpha/beta superfamily hydrolase
MIGYEPRDVYLDLAQFFASSGIATLRYDRRGAGASEGDWRQMTFAMQADDALASVRFLQQHSAVHRAQIGLWGLSQTGWIAPLAASRSRDVAFIIPVSAPGVSVAQQELYRIGQWMRTDGRTEPEIAAVIAYMMQVYDVLRAGAG